MDILALLQPFNPILAATAMRQMSRVLTAMLAMTGRVTMLNIARWASKGGSYRSVQRFFHTAIPWAELLWLFFRQHLLCPQDEYIVAGDEVVVSKAGKQTYGLDRFFSSLCQRAIPGLSFFALSLVSIQQRRSFPIAIEQVVRTEEEKAASGQGKQQGQAARRRGRPKGSKNKSKVEVVLNAELLRIKAMLSKLLARLLGWLVLKYLVLDGHFGHNAAVQMARQCQLHLISKLRADAALYLPYKGPYAGRGPRRRYGDKVNYQALPKQHLKSLSVEDGLETRIYQATCLHKEFAQALNVVIIVKTNLQTGACAHVVLFSSDLELPFDKLIDYYSLRFQIEFNFRDAKQFWGLEDFMNVSQTAVSNAANLSLFMVNLVHLLLLNFRKSDPLCSILDLKSYYRGCRYVSETIKMLPQTLDDDSISQILSKVAALGRIHAPQATISLS